MTPVFLLEHDGEGLCQTDPVHLYDSEQRLALGVPLLQDLVRHVPAGTNNKNYEGGL